MSKRVYNFSKRLEEQYQYSRNLGIKSRKGFIKYRKQLQSERRKARYYANKYQGVYEYEAPVNVPFQLWKEIKYWEKKSKGKLDQASIEDIASKFDEAFHVSKKKKVNQGLSKEKSDFIKALGDLDYGISERAYSHLEKMSDDTFDRMLTDNANIAKVVDYIKSLNTAYEKGEIGYEKFLSGYDNALSDLEMMNFSSEMMNMIIGEYYDKQELTKKVKSKLKKRKKRK